MIKKIAFVFFVTIIIIFASQRAFSELPIASDPAFGIGFEDIFAEFPYYDDQALTVSMDFKDASLKDILKAFSIQSGLNFIASQSVEDRTITLYLDNVPLKGALDKLFKANNLSYELDEASRIIIVKDWGKPEIERITKIYSLKYASVSTSNLRGELATYLGEEGTSSSSSTTTSEGRWSTEETAGLTSVIKAILTEDGQIIEEPRTNSIIITDIPSRFPAIEEVIKRLDVAIAQIMLEVEMLDVSKTTADKVGIKWGDISSSPSILAMTLSGAAKQSAFPFKSFFASQPADVAKTFTPGSVSFSNPYTVLLQFIKSQADTKVLARPRILTLNNETAEISIISDEVVGTKSTTSTDTGTTIVEEEARASDFALTAEGVGVFLRVTPQINPDTGEITMFVYPKVSSTKASTIGSARDPEVRSTKSVVRIKNGETIVVGGLIRTDKAETITSVPVLSDIPLLGNLFRHRNRSKDDIRELLIFITPHIIEDTETSKLAKIEREQSP